MWPHCATGLERLHAPGVAVDLAILTVVWSSDTNPTPRILAQDRDHPHGQALLGGFIRESATVAETVNDVLARKVGTAPDSEVRRRLFRIFDDPSRDDRTWTISIAHSVLVRKTVLADATGDLLPLTPTASSKARTGCCSTTT